jgi:micrococcal nuclease|tara:strand:- start:177 stop:596 length:420 start_codon:yes stop_codon:yes gene_type:complete
MYEYKCHITRIVDGDTVDANIDCGFDIIFKSRIRLYGVDTPESRTRDLDEKARGKMASAFLQEQINKAELVKVKTKLDKKGKFGRVLGSIIADDIDLNQAMIEKNLAVAYFGQSKDDIEAEHLVNRQKLIEAGLHIPVE